MNIRTYQFFGGTTIPGIPRDAFVPGLPVVVDLDSMTIVPPHVEETVLPSEPASQEAASIDLSEGEGSL
jgi:hypothetical protein